MKKLWLYLERQPKTYQIMSKRKKWTAAEDTLLVGLVRKSPTNLRQAFIETARVIKRSESACAARWYTKLSKDKSNACFVTVSASHQTFNRKNGPVSPCADNLFKHILKLLNIIK